MYRNIFNSNLRICSGSPIKTERTVTILRKMNKSKCCISIIFNNKSFRINILFRKEPKESRPTAPIKDAFPHNLAKQASTFAGAPPGFCSKHGLPLWFWMCSLIGVKSIRISPRVVNENCVFFMHTSIIRLFFYTSPHKRLSIVHLNKIANLLTLKK